MQTNDSSWSDEDREIDRLETLVSENAAESLKWRTLLQNERDHMAAALLEIDRLKTVIGEMTINQQMQDSITAAVMERAEKAEAENEVVRSMYLNEQGRCEALRVDAERYQWLRTDHPIQEGEPFIARSFIGGISQWTLTFADEAIDAARSK